MVVFLERSTFAGDEGYIGQISGYAHASKENYLLYQCIDPVKGI